MKTLQDLVQTQLPINRKEVFFTATVLPMIIAKDNFKHLHLLLTELGISPIPEIVALSSRTNIQFFTEYNLLESLHGTARRQEFQDNNLPSKKHTPDLMILIDAPQNKILIALEAKMYSSPRPEKLKTQMKAQENMLETIKKTLNCRYYHFALLPEKLVERMGKIEPSVITWERICTLFESVAEDDYFMRMLKIALNSYDTLASSSESSYGKNNEEYMTGQEIYNAFKNKTLKNQFMGRQSGIDGQSLKNDLRSDGWKTQPYQTRKTELSKKNWFSVKDFVEKIDGN